MRKINLEEAHPDSQIGKRQSMMECTKQELIFMIEKSRSRIRFLEGESEKYRTRWQDGMDDTRQANNATKKAQQQLYEQMDTTIGAFWDQSKKLFDDEMVEAWHYTMTYVRVIETLLEEFNQANPDLRAYEYAATRYGAETFNRLCRAAKYQPRKRTRSSVLYSKGDDYWDEENGYEYHNIHDVLSDEILEEVYEPYPILDV